MEYLSDKWPRYQDISTVTAVHLRGNIYSLVVSVCAAGLGSRGIFFYFMRSSELTAVISRNSFNSFVFVKDKEGCM